MGRDLTKRYVEEMIEALGLKTNVMERTTEILRMSDESREQLLSDLRNRVERHYRENLSHIKEDLCQIRGRPKAYHFGSDTPLRFREATPDRFIRQSAFYFDKIVVRDPIEGVVYLDWSLNPRAAKSLIAKALTSLNLLKPWVAGEVVELVPPGDRDIDIKNRLNELAEQDSQDPEWQQQALKNEDLGIEGEAYLVYLEWVIRDMVSQKMKSALGDPRQAALAMAINSTSVRMGEGFFGSSMTNCSVATDLQSDWRLFGHWILRRCQRTLVDELGRDRSESFIREVKAGRAWLSLEAGELGVLLKLPPEKIIEVRNSADYSLKYFREDLGDAVDEIEGLKLDDEAEYREAAAEVWKKVRDDARKVRKDMDTIKSKIGARIDLTFASLFLATLPFDIAKLAAAVIGSTKAIDLLDKYIDLRAQKKSTGYFLVKLDETARTVRLSSQHSTSDRRL